jgi:phosphoserine phosphatase RsbU/P
MRRNSLSFKIILRVLISCACLGILIFSVQYSFTRHTIEKTTRENTQLLAENAINEIEKVIRPVQMIPENLAWMMESNSLSEDSIYSFLEKLVAKNPTIYASTIAFEPNMSKGGMKHFAPSAYREGEKIGTTQLGSADFDYFIMDWYEIPAMLGQPYWSEPFYDTRGAGTLLSTYSVPFYLNKNGQRKLGGVITVDISLDWLTKIISSVKILKTGYAFLVSRTGVFVTHPKREYIMNQTLFTVAKEDKVPAMREIGRTMIQGKDGYASVKYNERGKIWIYYNSLPSSKWSLGVIFPHNEMYADIHDLTILILLLSMIGLGLLVFITVRIINKQINPLTLFAKSALKIAEGHFDTELPKIESQDEMKELHDSFEFMQKELAEYVVDLKETTTAKEKIESELRIAKEIQMGMIPHIFPPFPNLPEIDLYASLESAREVGGDLYDFFLLDDHLLCFAIGDVSGKGVPSSLFMAVTRTLLRSVANKDTNTSEIASSINRTLTISNESNMFVTFFVGILNTKTNLLQFCNAGHNPPILIRGGKEAEFFGLTKSIPVGLFEDFDFKEERIQLDTDDQLFLYTDGLTEAEDVNNNLYGNERLLEVIRKNADAAPKELIELVGKDVKKHVNGHIQSDDLTMLSIICHGYE